MIKQHCPFLLWELSVIVFYPFVFFISFFSENADWGGNYYYWVDFLYAVSLPADTPCLSWRSFSGWFSSRPFLFNLSKPSNIQNTLAKWGCQRFFPLSVVPQYNQWAWSGYSTQMWSKQTEKNLITIIQAKQPWLQFPRLDTLILMILHIHYVNLAYKNVLVKERIALSNEKLYFLARKIVTKTNYNI